MNIFKILSTFHRHRKSKFNLTNKKNYLLEENKSPIKCWTLALTRKTHLLHAVNINKNVKLFYFERINRIINHSVCIHPVNLLK